MVFDKFQPFMNEYDKNEHLKGFLSSGFYGYNFLGGAFSTIEQCAKLYE